MVKKLSLTLWFSTGHMRYNIDISIADQNDPKSQVNRRSNFLQALPNGEWIVIR